MEQALVFLGILSLVVLVHELGHFFVARLFGIKVEEFGFGLPPRLATLWKKKGTEYTLNWLPIGGFVRMLGEDENSLQDTRSFGSKKIWQRAAVLLAGVVMNFLLGVVLFAIVYSILGVPSKIGGIKILEVVEGSPAFEVGIQVDDVILELGDGGEEIVVDSVEKFVGLVGESKGQELVMEVSRGEEKLEFVLTPRENPPEGEGSLGVVITDIELVPLKWWEVPTKGVWVGLQEAVAWGKEIATGLITMVVRLVTGQGLEEEVAGPIGIYQISNEVRKQGILSLLQFVGVFSINLAILNLMPIPALDGGRLLFVGIELVRGGKKMKQKWEGWANMAGMVSLLSLMAVVTLNDIVRLLGGWGSVVERVAFW